MGNCTEPKAKPRPKPLPSTSPAETKPPVAIPPAPRVNPPERRPEECAPNNQSGNVTNNTISMSLVNTRPPASVQQSNGAVMQEKPGEGRISDSGAVRNPPGSEVAPVDIGRLPPVVALPSHDLPTQQSLNWAKQINDEHYNQSSFAPIVIPRMRVALQ